VSTVDELPLDIWLSFWRLARRYHRYTVNEDDLHKLAHGPASLIVGYHGQPVPWDMCMLGLAIYEKRGYLPAGIVHRAADSIPPVRWLAEGINFFRGDDDRLTEWVAADRHVMVTPGGGAEAGRSFRNRYRVDWGDRLGYVRLAVKLGLRIVPVGASGVDHAYIGLNDSSKLGRRLGLPRDLEPLPWIGLGPLGMFPFSPPFRVEIDQLIGKPILPAVEGVSDVADEAGLRRVHRMVATAVQTLLDQARLPSALREQRADP